VGTTKYIVARGMERAGPADASPPAFVGQNGPPCVSAVNSCVISPVPPAPYVRSAGDEGVVARGTSPFWGMGRTEGRLTPPLRPGTFDL